MKIYIYKKAFCFSFLRQSQHKKIMFGRTEEKGHFGKPANDSFYTILDIVVDAQTAVVKKAFRAFANKNHPDKGGANSLFQYGQRAYEVLSDPELRACYDAFGIEFEHVPDLHVFKTNLRGTDILIPVKVSLKDLFEGYEQLVEYTRKVKEETVEEVFKIPIPPDYTKDLMIQSGMGNQETGKILPGDMVLLIDLDLPENFEKVGNCLVYSAEIGFAEALVGSPIKIEHPCGKTFFVTLENGDDSFVTDETYALEGLGMNENSPLLIRISVDDPIITPDQKRTLCQLFEVSCENKEKGENVKVGTYLEDYEIDTKISEGKSPVTENVMQNCNTQ
jgi:DnaJ-class molecular chaperone